MSVTREAARSGAWFAGFKFLGQLLSWSVTIVVVRLLSPADYGLMSIATIATGYVEVFSELGLGAAVVQRPVISQQEYSSNFWFSLMVGTGFAVVSFLLAYPTAWMFNEPGVIPITQSVGVFFIIGALTSIPFNILTRDLRFREIGAIQLTAVIASTCTMLWMAYSGYGVWTLVGGTLVARLVTGALVFRVSGWRPLFHFRWAEVRGFLRFGLNVAAARSFFFVFQKVDVFIIGKLLGTQSVGYYSIAMQLANMPTDKIAAVVNQIAFPLFAKFQHDQAQLRNLYLRITRVLAIVLAPFYLAGAVWGGDIIAIALAEKWAPAAFLFRALCLAQLATSLTILNTPLHTAVGRAHWPTYFYAICVPAMASAMFVSAHYGLNAVVVPWLTVYPVLVVAWSFATLRSIDADVVEVGVAVGAQICFSALAVLAARWLSVHFLGAGANVRVLLAVEVGISAIIYSTYLFISERKVLTDFWGLRRA